MSPEKQNKLKDEYILPLTISNLEKGIKSKFENNSSEDLIFSTFEHKKQRIAVFGLSYLIDPAEINESLLAPLLSEKKAWTSARLLNDLPLSKGRSTKSLEEILDEIIAGAICIYIEGERHIVFFPMLLEVKRSLEKSENESVVLGPQISFTESLDTNMNVLRNLIPSPNLVMEKLSVGSVIPCEIRIVYMKTVANEADVNTMRQRIQDLDIEEVQDITAMKQFLEDSSTNLFPQFTLTELPTHVSYVVKQGKIAVLAENSPNSFIAPSTFFSFFESMEDVYMRWNGASAVRLLRMLAMIIALFLTPLYVATAMYHYELIPTALIVSIGQSRAGVPFPPLLEALIIEIMIELLREAGARLPTKVGQTMGIVGGIVIGQAAVEAGLTSNVLIIVVAISALASFTTPNYSIGSSFRVLRFPLIILAGFSGLIGIMFGISLLIIHLLYMKSLGRPYLAPIYPLRVQDLKSVFYYSLPAQNSKRASMYRPKDKTLFSEREAKKKRDIEE